MDIIFLLEWIAFAYSILLLHPGNDKVARMLIVILLITVIAETTGFYLRIHHRTNHPVYNISVPAIILLFLILFRNAIQTPGYKKTVFIVASVYFVFSLVNLLFIQKMAKFATYNYIAGTITLILSVTLYLLGLIRKHEYVFISKEPLFWIAVATLILYVPKAILYAMFEYLAYTKGIMDSFGATFHLLNTFLSVIFFSLLIYASICRLKFRS